MSTLVWFRQDLRIADNPALAAALERGPVIPLYILDEHHCGEWALGGAQRWWLHQSLAALSERLRECGSRLILRHGRSEEVIAQLLVSNDVDAVYWNRRYEPAAIQQDTKLKESLRAQGIDVRSFNSALLNEPWSIANLSGKPFQVFTPYWRHCLKLADPRPPEPVLTSIPCPDRWPHSAALDSLQLMPTIAWYQEMARTWTPGEHGAAQNLKEFVKDTVWSYTETRNLPAMRGTSMLSPHLRFGEISPHQVWHAVKARGMRDHIPTSEWRPHQYLTEIYWREFAYHLLFHFAHTPTEPLRPEFARFPWARNPAHLQAWQRGRTGVPMIDAGMRQLWATGWMHNRVRMIVGSFLVKNLLLPWQDGSRWFWDTLVDADLASNTLGWQWCAGCGADAAPFFRIFNPVSQGEKFDPQGEYVRRWVPELARLPDSDIHSPWDAASEVLGAAGVTLGRDYPHPMVDLKATRARALDAYQTMRGRG
jgi:deoxyribodipyrimidine photo-lyase